LYDANNKDGRRERDARRARASGGSRQSFDLRTKCMLFESQHGLCLCCMKPIHQPEDGEVDHIVPLRKGGGTSSSNLLLAHAQCNREKHNKTLVEHWKWRVLVGLDAENIGKKYRFIVD
jgi:5-methylcytosine-specific restriction endonuclease McrA